MSRLFTNIDAKCIGTFVAGTLINVSIDVDFTYKPTIIQANGKTVPSSCSCSTVTTNTATTTERSNWIYDFLAA